MWYGVAAYVPSFYGVCAQVASALRETRVAANADTHTHHALHCG